MFWLSALLLLFCLATYVALLVIGLPVGTNELVVGRVLDAIAMTVLAYCYGSSSITGVMTALLTESIRSQLSSRI